MNAATFLVALAGALVTLAYLLLLRRRDRKRRRQRHLREMLRSIERAEGR